MPSGAMLAGVSGCGKPLPTRPAILGVGARGLWSHGCDRCAVPHQQCGQHHDSFAVSFAVSLHVVHNQLRCILCARYTHITSTGQGGLASTHVCNLMCFFLWHACITCCCCQQASIPSLYVLRCE